MSDNSIKIGLVVSEFNYDITYLMLQKAVSHADFLGAKISVTVKSPGTFDTPILVGELLRREDVDAVVVLGAVIQGETKHDEVGSPTSCKKTPRFKYNTWKTRNSRCYRSRSYKSSSS